MSSEAKLAEDRLTARPLVEAKIAAPLLRPGLIDRLRVREALEAGGAAALTLVAAPAGYGKTTAVHAWCADSDAALAWVGLDAGDNDPVRLWTYVATAVDRVRSGLGRPALRRLSTGRGSIEASVDELANSLAAFGDEIAIVLDDLQSVTAADCIESINHAIGHFPANARLIVISRADPALRLPQLRAHGELCELRARELAFSAEETHELVVTREGIDVSAAEAEVLHIRTEGWPAAVALAALWLHNVDDTHAAVSTFGGDHRFIADYFTAEVIASLDDGSRGFLLRACVLGEFTPELCDAALERDDSGALLTRLEGSNPFVTRLDRGREYRVHSLFAEFAGFQLAALEPGVAADIHRRASAWYGSHGRFEQAAEHAAAAGEQALVVDILLKYYVSLVRSGQVQALLRWVRTLDDDHIVRHPELAVSSATAATMVGRAGLERRRYLELVKRTEVVYPERMSAYARASAEMVRAASLDGGVGAAVEAGRRAVEIARAHDSADVSLVAALGSLARALYLAGEVDDAWAIAMQAIEHPDIEHRAPGHAFARATLALAALDCGWESSARGHADRAKALVDDLGLNRTWLGANAAIALGCVLAAEGHLSEAEREFATAEQFFRDEVFTIDHTWLLVLLAGVRCRRGRLEGAQEALRSAKQEIETFADGGRIPLLVAGVERDLELARSRFADGEILERPSDAEFAVLRLLPTDLSAREIAGELFISSNTVSSHTRALYRKLGVKSREDAVARAEVLGLLG